MMSRRAEFSPGSFVDIQILIEDLGVKDKALRKMYANLLGKCITKTQQLSNWEADILSEQQMIYAATDAWACINLYKEIMRLKETNDYRLIITEESNEESIPQ